MNNPQPYDEKHKAYRPAANGGGVWFPGKGGYPRDTSMFEDQPEDPGPDPLPDYASPSRYRPDSEFQDPYTQSDSRYPDHEPYPDFPPSGRDEYETHASEHVHFLGERTRGRVHTTSTLITASCLSFAIGGAAMLFTLTILPALLIALLSH